MRFARFLLYAAALGVIINLALERDIFWPIKDAYVLQLIYGEAE